MKAKAVFTLTGLLMFALVCGSAAQSQYFTLKQPDGTSFSAMERGDEWLRFFETPEGYIVRRGPDGFFQYFNINATGEFVVTGLRVGIHAPVGVPVRPYNLPELRRALEQRLAAYNAAAERNRQRFLQRQRDGFASGLGKRSGTTFPSIQQELTLDMGILLVEFNGRPHYTGGTRPNGYTISDFETMHFSNNIYKTQPPGDPNGSPLSPDNEVIFGSMRDYFEFQSHGLLHLSGQIINPNIGGIPTWLNMGSSTPYDSQLGESDELLRDAINAAINLGWNCNYDIVGVLVSQDDWTWYAGGVAWFQSNFSAGGFHPTFDYANWFGGFVFNERNAAEYRNSSNATFSHIGLIGHEVFHVLGWGIYNILAEGGEVWIHAGQGDWSFMNVGYRTGPLRKDESPGDLDAVARIVMEWAVPTEVAASLINEQIEYLEIDDDPMANFDFYRFDDPGSSNEFIVENRQYSGFNAYLPEWWKTGAKGGLIVWWRDGQTRDLRRADNDNDVVLEGLPNVSDGDLVDPFPGSSNNLQISMATTPNSQNTSANPTGFALTNISASATTMTATFHKSYLASNSADALVSNSSRKLARDSGGNYHLVFETGSEIYYQKSTDGGATWSVYTRLSLGNGSNKFPSIAERSGKLYAIWQRKIAANTYNLLLRHFTGTSWGTIRTVTSSIASSNDPLPVIAISKPSASFEMMVAYRTGSGLKSKLSTSTNGSIWPATEYAITTNTSGRNPSLVYRGIAGLSFNVTWDDGSNISHQVFNGSTWGAVNILSNNTASINHQYSSYALSGNNTRHVTWQALEQEVIINEVIYHNMNLSNLYTVFSSPSWDYLRPSITGHAGAEASLLCHDNNSTKNIRKRRFNGTAWLGTTTIIANNGMDASTSIANPPGATALGVWRSTGTSPYALITGPSGGLSKENGEEDYVYHRRIVYSDSTGAKLMLQIDNVEIIAGKDKSELPFPEVGKDSLLTSELAETISFRNLSLPADADSLVLKISLYSKDSGALRQNKNQTLTAAFELSSGASRASVSLPTFAHSGEARNTIRLGFPVQNLRSRLVHLLPKFSNLENEKSRGALLHVYETIEDGAQKAGSSSQQITKNQSAALELSVHPNPFNPSTVIRFNLPEENVVSLRIYDVQGRTVQEWHEQRRAAGEHSIVWDGHDQFGKTVASGIYFSELRYGALRRVARMVLVR